MSKFNKIVNNINEFIPNEIKKEFISREEEVKDIILNEYDNLSNMITDTESKSDPYIFREVFESKLNEFTYVIVNDNTEIIFRTPDLDNFNFSGLKLVRQILEGTAGVYVEISHDDLVKMTGKTTVNEEPIDTSVAMQDRIYLYRYSDWVRKKEKDVLNKKLVRFPFSNTPALGNTVFGPAQSYVNDNIDRWVDSAVKRSTKIISQKYKRV